MYGINYVKLISIGVVSLVLFLSGWTINGWRWDSKYQALVTQYEEAALKAEREARNKEKVLQASVDNERQIKDEKIRSINTQLNSALEQLRQRPTRESNSKSTCDCKGANGSKLFREDAHFLTREAARADRAVTELKSCYASYDAVRNELNDE